MKQDRTGGEGHRTEQARKEQEKKRKEYGRTK